MFLLEFVILFTGGVGVSASVHAGMPPPPSRQSVKSAVMRGLTESEMWVEGKRDRENVSTCEHGYYRQRRNKEDDEKHEDFMGMQETQRRVNANNKTNTRMHSSRMRTARLFPVSLNMHREGYLPGGMYLPGGIPAQVLHPPRGQNDRHV